MSEVLMDAISRLENEADTTPSWGDEWDHGWDNDGGRNWHKYWNNSW